MKALEVHNLRKEFVRREGRSRRRVAALGGVSFDVERGECVAVLGPNGSGKSTLVRLLSTLLLPDGGSASVFGHDAEKDTRTVRRLVNRVSVEASFFKKMSAVENLSYAARFYGLRPAQTRERIPEILTRVGFPGDRRAEPMENLSRGMQQKVALARALLTAPILLLLDEPTTGLDPRSKQEVQEFIREVRAEHDATVLLCTSSFERGSRPVVGSSSRSRIGEVSSARASATFCCVPRERFSIACVRRDAGKPTRSRISGIRSRVSRGVRP